MSEPHPDLRATRAVAVWIISIAQALLGAALIIAGLWSIYPPAALIFSGMALWAGAIRFARTERNADVRTPR